MLMNVQVLQHAPFEGLAVIGSLLEAKGASIKAARLFETPVLPSLAGIDLVIAMGGPMSVNDETEFPWLIDEKRFIREAVRKGIPVLGVCLGSQLIASALGARVYRNSQKEIGWFPVTSAHPSGEAFQFPEKLEVFHWHGETFDLPTGAVHLAQSEACKHQAFQVGRRTIGLQCHLEVTPEAAKAFVDHCGAELKPAPFVQMPEAILGKPTSTYTATNAWMSQILDYLVE
jgi:GMP synthase-like glutamine amidotransferase